MGVERRTSGEGGRKSENREKEEPREISEPQRERERERRLSSSRRLKFISRSVYLLKIRGLPPSPLPQSPHPLTRWALAPALSPVPHCLATECRALSRKIKLLVALFVTRASVQSPFLSSLSLLSSPAASCQREFFRDIYAEAGAPNAPCVCSRRIEPPQAPRSADDEGRRTARMIASTVSHSSVEGNNSRVRAIARLADSSSHGKAERARRTVFRVEILKHPRLPETRR